jgi:hypothetical protein
MVERSTHYVMLLNLPDRLDTIRVEGAMKAAISSRPTELFKTLAWDRGKEMARHKEIKVATGVRVYFRDPPAPGSAVPSRKPIGRSASSCSVEPISPDTAGRTCLTLHSS